MKVSACYSRERDLTPDSGVGCHGLSDTAGCRPNASASPRTRVLTGGAISTLPVAAFVLGGVALRAVDQAIRYRERGVQRWVPRLKHISCPHDLKEKKEG